MKTSLLLCAALALSVSAKEYRVELEAVPGADPVFFLDLGKTGADSSTFRLTGPDGKEIPFSFDMRLARPSVPGNYNKQPDGYYTKDTAPASENRFMHPGWLSFKQVPNAKKYTLTFEDGAKETLARPNPAVRAWWIEIMHDPELKKRDYLNCAKDSLKMLPDGGIEVTRPFQFWMSAAAVDERINGRRIIGLMRCEGNFTYYYVRLKNAVMKKNSALSFYFQPVPGVIIDVCGEGVLDHGQVFNPRSFFGGIEYVKAPSRIYRFHVQLPPAEHAAGVKLKSDMLNAGETVTFEPYGLGYENIMPFESGGVKGFRVGRWDGKPSVRYALLNADGVKVKSGEGMQFKLDGVKTGKYQLTAELLVDGISAGKKVFPLTVQSTPF